MTTDNVESRVLLQRQLGLHRYEQVDDASTSSGEAMVNVAASRSHGEVEIDDTWIGGTQAGLRGSHSSRAPSGPCVGLPLKSATKLWRLRMV